MKGQELTDALKASLADRKRKVVQVIQGEQGLMYLCDDGSIWWQETAQINYIDGSPINRNMMVWRQMDLSGLENA